jgi:hypothetical protein
MKNKYWTRLCKWTSVLVMLGFSIWTYKAKDFESLPVFTTLLGICLGFDFDDLFETKPIGMNEENEDESIKT